MVVGLGTDIIEIERIRGSLERFGDQFRDRIFTPAEIAYCEARNRTSAQSYAARFAAKEAAAKALGTGISRGVSWKEIEVRRAPGHAPTLAPHGTRRRARPRAGSCSLLAVTHSWPGHRHGHRHPRG